MTKDKKQLRVTLKKSVIGALPVHKQCVKGLGLRRISHVVTLEDTPCVRGMINRASHLLSVEEV